MKEKIQENELKIHKAIQELKDSVFGLKRSFKAICLNNLDGNVKLDPERTERMIEELLAISRSKKSFRETYEKYLGYFFEVSIKFLVSACPEEDWSFLGIKKLSQVIYKSEEQDQSTFDIMVDSAKSFLQDDYSKEDTFWEHYQELSSFVVDADQEVFQRCIKHTLEEYIDVHKMNTLFDDDATQKILEKLEYCSWQIQQDVSRMGDIEEEG